MPADAVQHCRSGGGGSAGYRHARAGLLDTQGAATDLLVRLKSLVPDISRDAIGATSSFVRAEDRARLIEGLGRTGLN